ncbi:MAG TPA: MJ0042-type zinc finger domain-containing protein [Xanthobacteraceae bacterium]|nr:MJ0042-type zinc finger domain-containing protein [Xanthobacteraceae bacterium]
MLIACPNCQTSYEVSAASLGEAGRTVRCVRCRETWFATPSPESAAATAAAVSAAAATARYQQGAAPRAEALVSASAGADRPADGDPEIDPNLAARAADRDHVSFDDPPAIEAEALAAFAAGEAPPLAPAAEAAAPAAPSAKDPHDIESIAARRARRQKYNPPPRDIRPGITMLIGLLVLLNGAILLWRYDVVRAMPQTASLFAAIGLPVNLRGLEFTDVKMSSQTHQGVTVMMIDGTISNISREPHEVPRLRFAVRNAAGAEIYTWTTLPERGSLAAGEAQPFQTRLASPPGEGRDVVVRFFNRRDLATGGR